MAKPDTRIASTDESLLSEPDDLRPAEEDAKEDERDTRTFFRGRLLGKVRAFLNENGPLAAMFAVVFVNLVGFGIVVPLMPFFAQSLEAQAWQVTLMFTTYSLGQFFAEPYFGRLSDRIGRKPILIITTALSVLFYVLLAFSPNIWIAILIRFFSGLSSGNISTIQGYVSDVSPPEKRSGRMSLIGGAFSLGFIIGPFIGGILSHETAAGGNQFRLPLMGAALLSALACLGVMLFIRESRERRTKVEAAQPHILKTAQEALQSPVLVRLILSTLCYMMAFAGLESTFGLWAEARFHWGPKEIGAIFLPLGIAAALMQMVFMRPLTRRYGESKVLAAGLFVFGLSFVLQGMNHIGWLITPIIMLGALGQAVIFSSICAIISLSTSPDKQGAMLGLNMSTGAIARITGPMIAGYVFSLFGPDASVWMGAVTTLPAALLALQLGKYQKRKAHG
ncbi:MFS transporter [Asticcacaulis taihuensis]|uniref:Predicted arabinose efflux permease, MFS family n=1 Tax=Asticcacaulis taihuensis TaxID=260084 RepID=A0A1G4QL08_9CAUL|nr:MFS transporter [Asticcacaulis taihuensis]SCW45091.1 Predicted arabinose efflux permease, MFS family [Asticcacaulis taihuensis]